MPVTYIIETMQYVVHGRGDAGDFRLAVLALLGFGLGAVAAAGVMVRRAT